MQCGACWAFAAAGAVEAKYKISNGQDWDLSEQQLVDCLAHSCGGGDPAVALEYIYGYGLVPEAAYPFIGTSSSYLCNTSVLAGVPASDRAHLLVGQGFTFLESFSATELMKVWGLDWYLASLQPAGWASCLVGPGATCWLAAAAAAEPAPEWGQY